MRVVSATVRRHRQAHPPNTEFARRWRPLVRLFGEVLIKQR